VTRDQIIEAGAKAAWTADRKRALAASSYIPHWDDAHPTARAGAIRDATTHHDATAGLIATAAVEQLRTAVLAACDATEDDYAGYFHEGKTVNLTLIRAALNA
jgi:hypothetical protein